MVAGHTSSALLADPYRAGRWFDVWMFQRGLTSALFLLLAGFAFSVETTRHWPSHLHLSAAVVKRVRRALDHCDPERILLAPDCGMKYLSRDAAFGKLCAMSEAARRLRAEFGN